MKVTLESYKKIVKGGFKSRYELGFEEGDYFNYTDSENNLQQIFISGGLDTLGRIKNMMDLRVMAGLTDMEIKDTKTKNKYNLTIDQVKELLVGMGAFGGNLWNIKEVGYEAVDNISVTSYEHVITASDEIKSAIFKTLTVLEKISVLDGLGRLDIKKPKTDVFQALDCKQLYVYLSDYLDLNSKSDEFVNGVIIEKAFDAMDPQIIYDEIELLGVLVGEYAKDEVFDMLTIDEKKSIMQPVLRQLVLKPENITVNDIVIEYGKLTPKFIFDFLKLKNALDINIPVEEAFDILPTSDKIIALNDYLKNLVFEETKEEILELDDNFSIESITQEQIDNKFKDMPNDIVFFKLKNLGLLDIKMSFKNAIKELSDSEKIAVMKDVLIENVIKSKSPTIAEMNSMYIKLSYDDIYEFLDSNNFLKKSKSKAEIFNAMTKKEKIKLLHAILFQSAFNSMVVDENLKMYAFSKLSDTEIFSILDGNGVLDVDYSKEEALQIIGDDQQKIDLDNLILTFLPEYLAIQDVLAIS